MPKEMNLEDFKKMLQSLPEEIKVTIIWNQKTKKLKVTPEPCPIPASIPYAIMKLAITNFEREFGKVSEEGPSYID
jgi:hypothetical protein